MILENFLYSPNPGLDYAENIALYLDFKIRHPHLKPKTKEFSDALRHDPYFNALRVNTDMPSPVTKLKVASGKLPS